MNIKINILRTNAFAGNVRAFFFRHYFLDGKSVIRYNLYLRLTRVAHVRFGCLPFLDGFAFATEVRNTENLKTVATNKKAFHEYFVEESFECGIALSGTEIKSIRQGGVNLKDAWCNIENGEMIIKQMHISPYEHGNIFNKPPTRDRKLLMHKREIMRLYGTVKQEGLALVPLSLYFKGSLVKVQLGLCRGKKLHDKRQVAAKRDANRAIDRAIKEQNR